MTDYVYIWRYVVRDSAVEQFILRYSPEFSLLSA